MTSPQSPAPNGDASDRRRNCGRRPPVALPPTGGQEAVFWELPGEPFWLHESQPGVPGASPVTVWLEGVDFAVSGTKACRDQGVGYELFETHEELVAAVAADLA